ncbi:MAG: aminoacyl-tRNA hydrolase [Rickettsiaceae bacterium]|nr:aminoacyl-tRNA hydrolase [Rickettsiaceae bacterium]MDP4832806.1 aminoacyl-tRNA hydrolase [Rickettsiaceae bacterium]MDP5021330.1 aminoacyl-tRNA hydrolase [Rickettsiaceae bacterium]MDP5083328.1 aminoacyl-tRNA hydrolase [Rickettsiaceae bacterium]
MILIVGLGNPGTNYKNTRHNVGFIAVDLISNRYNFTWISKPKFNADLAIGECDLGKVVLCKPSTFMNLSGTSVQQISSFYKIPLDNIIVIHDDVDVPLGKVKYKIGGSAGGHNGLKSIDSHVGTAYHRVRIGIGRPENINHDIADYVLGVFNNNETELLLERVSVLVENLKLLVDKDLENFKAKLSC